MESGTAPPALQPCWAQVCWHALVWSHLSFIPRRLPPSWLDLGALHRTIKAGSLCAEPHPLSTYLRCKSK